MVNRNGSKKTTRSCAFKIVFFPAFAQAIALGLGVVITPNDARVRRCLEFILASPRSVCTALFYGCAMLSYYRGIQCCQCFGMPVIRHVGSVASRLTDSHLHGFSQGRTALHLAAENCPKIVQELLSKGYDKEAKDADVR